MEDNMDYSKVTEIISKERDEFCNRYGYLDSNGNYDYEEINRGECSAFLNIIYHNLIEKMFNERNDPIQHTVICMNTTDFTTPVGLIYDGIIYSDKFKDIINLQSIMMPPYLYNEITFDEIINLRGSLGNHYFLFFDGLFYDSECPQGVKYLFEIPFFKREIDELILRKNRPSGRLFIDASNHHSSGDKYFLDGKQISSEQAKAFVGTFVDILNYEGKNTVYLRAINNNFAFYYKDLGYILDAINGNLTNFNKDYIDEKYYESIGDNVITLSSVFLSNIGECDIVFIDEYHEPKIYIIHNKYKMVIAILDINEPISSVYAISNPYGLILEVYLTLNNKIQNGITVWQQFYLLWKQFKENIDIGVDEIADILKDAKMPNYPAGEIFALPLL